MPVAREDVEGAGEDLFSLSVEDVKLALSPSYNKVLEDLPEAVVFLGLSSKG